MDKVLSQNEIDALLNSVTDGRSGEGPDLNQGDPQQGVISYELGKQDRIIRGRMPTLDIIHDRFIRLFRMSLGASLRKMTNISVSSSMPIKFGEFINTLPLPSCLNIIRLEPLRGSSVFVIESKLLYAFVDTLLGGYEVPFVKIEGKEFTQIEIRLAKKIVSIAIEDFEKAWAPVFPLKIFYSRTEVNPQFVAVVPPSDIVIATSFEIELERITGSIKLIIPYSTLEPIKSKLSMSFQNEQLEVDHEWVQRMTRFLDQTYLNVKVLIGHCEVTIHDLNQLEVGDVLILDRDVRDGLDLFIETKKKFKVKPGLSQGYRAVKILDGV